MENAFGILSNRFRIFHMAINMKVENNNNWVVLACCVLHNFLRRKTTQQRAAGIAAVEDSDHPEEVASFPSLAEPVLSHRGTFLARQVREEYLEYLFTISPWTFDLVLVQV